METSSRNLRFFLSATFVLLVCILPGFAHSNSYDGAVFSFKLTNGNANESKTSFRVGEEVVIKTSLENNSNEMFPLLVSDENYQYKFTLIRDGEILPVPYREDKARSLSIHEETPGNGRQFDLDPLLPGTTAELATLNLSDRYVNLSPGRYTLKIEYKTAKIVRVDNVVHGVRLTHSVSFELLR